jgi:TolB-like protein
MKTTLIIFISLWLGACTHLSLPSHRSSSSQLEAGKWALLPFKNLAETPKATERAESIISSLLYSKGYQVDHYPAVDKDNLVLLLNDDKKQKNARQWAEQQGYRYLVSGDVTEWRYKTGLDADPSIGLSIRITDLQAGKVIYQRSGAKVGWGYSNLSKTAQNLLKQLLSEL